MRNPIAASTCIDCLKASLVSKRRLHASYFRVSSEPSTSNSTDHKRSSDQATASSLDPSPSSIPSWNAEGSVTDSKPSRFENVSSYDGRTTSGKRTLKQPFGGKETAESQLASILANIKLSARQRARAFSTVLNSSELQNRFQKMGGKINEATGYEDIERLRLGVAEKEKCLLAARQEASKSKKSYTAAVMSRAVTQREVNDLLQRKSTWSSADVIRFTDLVQRDHENEKAETQFKERMEAAEEIVERGFSELMQSILTRYHEEQVWSDKIRSLSTYGSLGITSLNVLLFIITILLVEPWKRKRLVEGVETRLRASTQDGTDSTITSINALRSQLEAAQDKLDILVTTSPFLPHGTVSDRLSPDEGDKTFDQVRDKILYDRAMSAYAAVDEDSGPKNNTWLLEAYVGPKTREKELWMVGVSSAIAGIGISAILGLLGGT